MFTHKRVYFFFPLLCCLPAFSQSPAHVEIVKVESRSSIRTVPLTAELAPFLQTDIEARSPGYVEKVLVDRGSLVHKGQLLVQLSAPEINSQTAASEASLHQAEADVAQAEVQAAAAESTSSKLQEAAKTPGAVAGNELLQAEKQKDAAQALVDSREAAVRSAKERLQASRSLESYLRVTAPFDGMITDRFVNPGMLIDGGRTPMLKLKQVAHLRLIVPVPETYTGSVARGMSAVFHVPARPGRSYTAKVARIPNALDQQSRAMMVELMCTTKTEVWLLACTQLLTGQSAEGKIFCLFQPQASSRQPSEPLLSHPSTVAPIGWMCGRDRLLARTSLSEAKSPPARRSSSGLRMRFAKGLHLPNSTNFFSL